MPLPQWHHSRYHRKEQTPPASGPQLSIPHLTILLELDPGIIPELSHIVDIRLFPNPNQGMFTVDITLREVADIQLRIYNEQFQLILSDQLTQTERWNRPVDLQGLSPSIYTLLVAEK